MTRDNYIPTCYFPSTVMIVENAHHSINEITKLLEKNIFYKVFNTTTDALEVVHNGHQLDQFNTQNILEDNEHSKSNYVFNLDLSGLHTEVYNPQRFNEASVIVVDFDLPHMNGLEFCRRMENSLIKRVLLTSHSNEDLVIQAFNDGIIDAYIQKNDVNLAKELGGTIKRLQLSYFQKMSNIVVRMLSVTSPSILDESDFFDLFYTIVTTNNIIEYYIMENSGSFLLLDADANPSYLIVKSQQDMQLHYELAICNQAPESVLNEFLSGEKIPCFWQKDNFSTVDWDDWSMFLTPAQKLIGKNTYFYAYVKNPSLNNIQPDRILSFKHYLRSIRR
ncbi:MAG: response regulator [Gammaproteobacteria bacterium]